MNYYGIVDKLPPRTGEYGRSKYTESDYKKRYEELKIKLAKTKEALVSITPTLMIPVVGVGALTAVIGSLNEDIDEKTDSLKIDHISKSTKDEEIGEKSIIIPNSCLMNNYEIQDEDYLFNLFQDSVQFKAIMRSGGNSNLIILERDNLPKYIQHYGGIHGKFHYGLYCEHPKNKNILMPLDNYNEIIKQMVLEETLRIYEALGAKEILIEDITSVDISNETTVKVANVDGNVNYSKEILRKKTYGKGAFDPDRAFTEIYFAPDLPNIMTVAEARINGNQTSEEFNEIVNLKIGLDIDVVKLFKNKTDFKYERKWHFKVEFYDKNEL